MSRRHDAIQTVMMRHEFYRDRFRWMLYAMLAQSVALVIAGYTIYYLANDRPSPEYFATTQDGRLIKMVPRSEPMLTQSAILTWAGKAATDSFTFDFVNFREQLQEAANAFTPDGWRSFLKALEDSRNLEAVRERKLIVNAALQGAPVILTEGVVNGVYSWRIEMPIVVAYRSATDVQRQNLLVNMTVSRVPTLEFPEGVGITQFVARPN
ncbi:MAG: type IVB secretion system apparatus protein IcmL/DotI [Alphaproteobacteria bacterium]|nr:type IVB secretion system apparatus protein IcmL/DotI [Alphaproteobacteria bacterium SS10]